MAAIKTDNLSNSNLMIVLLLISLLVVGVTALGGKALVTSIIRDSKVVNAKLTANKNLDTNLTNAPQLVSAYGGLGASSSLLDDALPTTSDFPSVLVTLENMSKDAGFTLKSVSPTAALDNGTGVAAAPSATQAQTFDFTVNFVGTYVSLHKFYADVETSIRPMRVTGMQLSGSGSALAGVIDMETYFQGPATVPITTENIK